MNPESGQTPYEEYRGRPFAGTVIPFGCRVLFLEHNQEKKDERLKFEPKSKDGVFLGYAQYGGSLVLDVAAFRDKKAIRVVTTRDTTIRDNEFPMFYLAEMDQEAERALNILFACLLYTSPSPRDATLSRMPSSA